MPNPVINRRLLVGGGSPVTLFTNLVSYWTLNDASNGSRMDSFGTNTLSDSLSDMPRVTGKGGIMSPGAANPEGGAAATKLFCASTPGLSGGTGGQSQTPSGCDFITRGQDFLPQTGCD